MTPDRTAPDQPAAGACHGTAVLVGRAGLLLRGASGSGKSLLAATLIGDGAILISDDRVYLTPRGGRLVARAPADIAGKIELRGRGIVARRFEPAAIIRLVVDLVEPQHMERMPARQSGWTEISGIDLPRQAVPAPGRGASTGPALILIAHALAATGEDKPLHLPQVSP